MSELDSLSTTSLSGVPMRRKAKAPDPAPMPVGELVASMREMANVLADNQRRLDALTGVLTSKPAKPQSASHTVGVSFEKGPDGLLTKGYVTNGERSWSLTFTRRDGQVFVTALVE